MSRLSFFCLALTLLIPSAPSGAESANCVAEELQGAWRTTDDGPERWLWFDGSRVLSAQHDQVHPITRLVTCTDARVELCSMGQIRTLEIDASGETLHVTDSGTLVTDAKTPRPYERMDRVPDLFRLKTYPVPAPRGELSAERIEELRVELLRRWQEDQTARREALASDDPDWGAVMALDRDNTAWLKDLMTEIGWPDPSRFGEDAARTAWLIVQHSMDIPLMEGALPRVREYGPGPDYARLYDRLEVWKGGRQRYGTQFTRDDEGPGLMPIESLEGIDAIRETMDLGPLADNAARMGVENVEAIRVISCE